MSALQRELWQTNSGRLADFLASAQNPGSAPKKPKKCTEIGQAVPGIGTREEASAAGPAERFYSARWASLTVPFLPTVRWSVPWAAPFVSYGSIVDVSFLYAT